MAEQTPSPGEALRTLRKLAGLTLKEVASAADTSIAYLSKVEQGKLFPSQAYVAKVASYISASMMTGVAA